MSFYSNSWGGVDAPRRVLVDTAERDLLLRHVRDISKQLVACKRRIDASAHEAERLRNQTVFEIRQSDMSTEDKQRALAEADHVLRCHYDDGAEACRIIGRWAGELGAAITRLNRAVSSDTIAAVRADITQDGREFGARVNELQQRMRLQPIEVRQLPSR
jgi:hypothetical protein